MLVPVEVDVALLDDVLPLSQKAKYSHMLGVHLLPPPPPPELVFLQLLLEYAYGFWKTVEKKEVVVKRSCAPRFVVVAVGVNHPVEVYALKTKKQKQSVKKAVT